MPEGYGRGGSADIGWWSNQIRAGIRYRERYAYEASWPRWRQYYRGEWDQGVLPKNVFFPMLRSVVPRVYFRNPQVSIRPAIPGFINMAFAQILNRMMNKLIVNSGLKHDMKRVVHDTFLYGSGFIKCGFGAMRTLVPTDSYEEAPVVKGEFFEYDHGILPGMPWAKRCSPGTIVLPDGAGRIQEARWIAQHVMVPKDDLLRDPRFSGVANGLPGTVYRGTGDVKTMAVEQTVEMVDLYEVRDRKYKRVFVYAPAGGARTPSSSGGRELLMENDDPFQRRGFPFKQVVFNEDNDTCWGVPHAQILEPPQLEANEIRTQTMHHRRAAVVKLLLERGSMSQDEIAKLLSPDAKGAVEVDGPPDTKAKVLQTAFIPQDLVQAESLNATDVRDTLGFSRNEFGEFQSRRGDTSAEEARNVHASSEIRVDEMRDAMADLLEEVVKEWMEIIFHFWTEDQVVDVVGPGGVPIWVSVNPSQLRNGRYIVTVDPDSPGTLSAADREALAIQRYTILKENPFIDPEALTKYMITEMAGVEMDDVFKQMPMQGMEGPGNNPMQPMSAMGLAGMLQQGMMGPGGPMMGAGGRR